jgi:hypothetical protein
MDGETEQAPQFAPENRPPQATAPAAAAAPVQVHTKAIMVPLLLLSPIAVLVGLGLLAITVYLLANLKTRRATLAMGGVLAALAVVVAVGVGLHFVRADFGGIPTVQRLEQSAVVGRDTMTPGAVAEELRLTVPAEGQPASDAKIVPAEMPAEEPAPKSLLRVVGTALGRAVATAKEEAARQAVKEMTSAAEAPAPAYEPAADRPEWVDREPDRTAKGDFEMPIYVGPYATRTECRDALAARLEAAVGEYAATAIGPQAKGRVRLPLSYVQENVVQGEWEEWKRFEPPLGEMVKLHVLLAFDREANARLQEEWRQVVVGRRLRALGSVGAVLLALLATAWGYLKIDLATGGRNRGRLRLGAAAVATAVLVTGVLLLA